MGQVMTEFQERLYLIFTGIFIASLVACNLIFQKFFTWNFLGIQFELSVGIIAYPVTFLVTDLISELFGKKRANQVVISGFFASVFTTALISAVFRKFGQVFEELRPNGPQHRTLHHILL